jgi:hypothetical protein
MLMFGFARDSKATIYATVAFTLFTTMSGAALTAVSSAAVRPDEQGKLQVGTPVGEISFLGEIQPVRE